MAKIDLEIHSTKSMEHQSTRQQSLAAKDRRGVHRCGMQLGVGPQKTSHRSGMGVGSFRRKSGC